MAQKYYVVWQGRQTGVFTDWQTCKKQVDGYTGARYKSFTSKAEADAAYGGAPSSATKSVKSVAKRKPSTPKTYSGVEVEQVDAGVKIFTDGGCEPNPGKAGSGIAVYRNNCVDQLWYGLYNENGTNNTAELNALHQAMIMAQQLMSDGLSVAIFCDSKYSIQCITQWAAGWKKKGWKKSGGEIKNLSLIQEMYELYTMLKSDIRILHVNGHVGVEGNELADRMSILAIGSREKGFVQYSKPIVVDHILAMRMG